MSLSSVVRADSNEDLSQRYLAVYLGINDAEHLEKNKDFAGALKGFQDCSDKLQAIHVSNPDWHTALVMHRLDDFRAKILDLQDKMAEAGKTTPAKESLDQSSEAFPRPIKTSKTSYSWKKDIATDVFWIGKDGVTKSAWDDSWVKSNGGIDTPDKRAGYWPAGHISKLNPFYVALPFNDLAHPDLAQKWVPAAWTRQPQGGKAVSVCRDRWVEIKNADGRKCYAQWEDVGPHGDADPEYVFGNSAPKAGDKAALSVSPAVAQYLNLGGDDAKPVSWRFVDDSDVPPGVWLRYDEMGVLYTAQSK